MQIVYILIAVVLLGGGYYFFSNNADAPAATNTNEETNQVEDSNTAAGTQLNDAEREAAGESMDDDPDMIGGDATVDADASMDLELGDSSASVDAEATAQARVFNVGGVNFAFDVEEIRVKEGDTVTINFESTDGFHDWVVDEFNAATAQVRPGTPTSVTFVADKKGSFEYYCSVGQHRANGMVGTLIVE